MDKDETAEVLEFSWFAKAKEALDDFNARVAEGEHPIDAMMGTVMTVELEDKMAFAFLHIAFYASGRGADFQSAFDQIYGPNHPLRSELAAAEDAVIETLRSKGIPHPERDPGE